MPHGDQGELLEHAIPNKQARFNASTCEYDYLTAPHCPEEIHETCTPVRFYREVIYFTLEFMQCVQAPWITIELGLLGWIDLWEGNGDLGGS